ncbi:MAG: hypothetical protein ACT4QF_16365 [Sporichthyaceae bacterium]
MTTPTLQLAGTRVLLNGPLTCEAHIDAMLAAADLLEREGAVVLYPLSPNHPANHLDLFDDVEFDPTASPRTEAACLEAAELVVLLPGWEGSGDVILDVLAAEAAGICWVEFERLPLA